MEKDLADLTKMPMRMLFFRGHELDGETSEKGMLIMQRYTTVSYYSKASSSYFLRNCSVTLLSAYAFKNSNDVGDENVDYLSMKVE